MENIFNILLHIYFLSTVYSSFSIFVLGLLDEKNSFQEFLGARSMVTLYFKISVGTTS